MLRLIFTILVLLEVRVSAFTRVAPANAHEALALPQMHPDRTFVYLLASSELDPKYRERVHSSLASSSCPLLFAEIHLQSPAFASLKNSLKLDSANPADGEGTLFFVHDGIGEWV